MLDFHVKRAVTGMVWSVVLLSAAIAAQKPQTIREGMLDEIELHATTIPSDLPVVVRRFAVADTDLGSGGEGGREGQIAAAARLKERAPALLADSLVSNLTKLGPYPAARVDEAAPAASAMIIVEGSFSKLDPGSRAKRYFVGFGAGRTTVEVKGTVRDASGATLATFLQRRHGAMGVAGGDSADKMADDSASIGEDIAKFLSAWAKGQSLK